VWFDDGVEIFFSETDTFAKTQVARHETSQDIKDDVEMLLKCLRLRHCRYTFIKTHHSHKTTVYNK